jgi:ATP-dependent Lon protease
VFFIGTANAVDTIPRVLLDRTEVLFLAGYSPDEKMEIAKRYLIPRQVTEAGLTPHQFQILDQALQVVIARYTREAGVRELERSIARLARKAAQHFAEGHTQPVIVKADDLSEMLGPERHMPERARTQLPVGVAAGLAWTEAGGEILYVEATLLPSGKGLRLTGLLGHVMKESAEAAQSYIWSHAEDLGIDASLFKGAGVHIHVPAGAVPKDGPSAGVAMAAALASLYTKLPGATDTAMTGEISLAGLVLPVGGIKEKVLAAHRAGIRRIVLPADNQKDLRDIPQNVRDQLQFVFANRIEQVLEAGKVTVPFTARLSSTFLTLQAKGLNLVSLLNLDLASAGTKTVPKTIGIEAVGPSLIPIVLFSGFGGADTISYTVKNGTATAK